MKKRHRSKMAGMVYSTRGSKGGRTQQERLRQKFISGDMTPEEQRELANIIVDTGQKTIPEAVWAYSKMLGKTARIPYKEFKEKWEPAGWVAIKYE